MKALVKSSIEALAAQDQKDLLSDILAFYVKEHVIKSQDFDDFLKDLCIYVLKAGELSRVQPVV